MGYNTKFEGEFRLDRPLDDETYEELSAMDGPFDECDGYPSRWCQWTVGDDWQSIRWNGGEKFYGYIGWIRLLNGRFLAPRGYRLGGTVRFQGEDPGDSGKIVAADGRIEVFWDDDDPKLSNYAARSKFKCHIPERQGVHWMDKGRKVFCDIGDLSSMDSEDEDAEWNKLLGITIGNPAALAVMVDISAVPGTNRPWPEWSLDDPGRNRIRILSLDMLLPIVDGERGARTRLTQIVEAAKRKKVCPGVWWHLPT